MCEDFSLTGRGNVVSNGTYRINDGDVLVRKLVCRTCGRSFCSRTGTPVYDLRKREDVHELALELLSRGWSARRVSLVLGVSQPTLGAWRRWARLSIRSKALGDVGDNVIDCQL
jgi:transposase-like protein